MSFFERLSVRAKTEYDDIRRFTVPVAVAFALVVTAVTATWGFALVREGDLMKIYKRFESVATMQDLARMETQMKDMTRALDDLRRELQSTREIMIEVAAKQKITGGGR